MNKKKIIAVIIILVVGILVANICYIFIDTYLELYLPPKHCMYLFGVSPEEFMDTYFEFYDETGDLRKRAYIDESGVLTLRLTRYQAQAWKKTEWLSGFSEYPDKEPFSISSDFKELTVYIPHGTDPNGEEYQSIRTQAKTILQKIAVLQSIDGVPDEYVGMEYTVVDEATGEVLTYQYVRWLYTD